jgi:hypothetical protein
MVDLGLTVRSKVPMHKFHLGQLVEFNPPRGIYAPRGAYVVTAKLPEKDGVFEYRVRSASEEHERAALENELTAVVVEDKPPEAADIKKHPPRSSGRPRRGLRG